MPENILIRKDGQIPLSRCTIVAASDRPSPEPETIRLIDMHFAYENYMKHFFQNFSYNFS